MILPCDIPQLDIPDVGRNHSPYFFLIAVRKIISVQEIYSDSLFVKKKKKKKKTCRVLARLCAGAQTLQVKQKKDEEKSAFKIVSGEKN